MMDKEEQKQSIEADDVGKGKTEQMFLDNF
jgi:hypothetical protein